MATPYDNNISLPPKVATDRYRKRIREEDLNRGEANYAKSAVAGSLAGLALKFKGMSRGRRAALGAAAGLAAQAVVRKAGASSKDFYGERSRAAKKSELLPVVAGLGTAAVLAHRRYRALSRFEFGLRPSLKRKLIHGGALAGGIAVADAATHAIFPDQDESRKAALAKGLKQGAVYGTVLAGVEPQLVAKFRRFLEREHSKNVIEFRVNEDEDLQSQRRRLAVLGGGALVGAAGLGLLALTGSKSHAAHQVAEAARKIPQGRGTVDRVAKFNKHLAERGYIHLKPMTPVQRKRFDKLPSAVQERAGEISKVHAKVQSPEFSPGERRTARQMLGAFRKQHNFSVAARKAWSDVARHARSYPTSPQPVLDAMTFHKHLIDKVASRDKTIRFKMFKTLVGMKRRQLPVEEAMTKFYPAKEFNVMRRGPVWSKHAASKLPAIRKLKEAIAYADAEKRLARKMYPAKLPPQREFMTGDAPQIMIVRRNKEDLKREASERRLRLAAAITTIGAGGTVAAGALGGAARKLAGSNTKLRVVRGLVKGAYKVGKARGSIGARLGFVDERLLISFKRQQLRESGTDRFADPLYAAATGQDVYAHLPGGGHRNYGGAAPLPLAHAQVLRAAYHKAGRIRTIGGRAIATASDVSDVVAGRPRKLDYAGRPKKREWEKAYAKRAVETAAVGAGVLGGAFVLKKNPRLRAKVLTGAANVRQRVNRAIPDFFAEAKLPALQTFTARKLLKTAAIGGAIGGAAGIGASLLRTPGRPLRENEDVTGKLLWRRSRVPLIRHYGVGVEHGRVAHVQAGRVGGKATFKVVDTAGFKDDRPVFVQASRRKVASEDLHKSVAEHNKNPGKFSIVSNNCEDAANCALKLNKPTSQAHDATVAAGVGAGVGLTGAALISPVKKIVRKARTRLLARRFRAQIFFDDAADYAGWDVRDPRGRSARVYAPGSRRRTRREKEWHETVEGQRHIRNVLIATAALAAGAGGVVAGRHFPKKPKAAHVTDILSPVIKFRPAG